jgi:hypothetical protein
VRFLKLTAGTTNGSSSSSSSGGSEDSGGPCLVALGSQDDGSTTLSSTGSGSGGSGGSGALWALKSWKLSSLLSALPQASTSAEVGFSKKFDEKNPRIRDVSELECARMVIWWWIEKDVFRFCNSDYMHKG